MRARPGSSRARPQAGRAGAGLDRPHHRILRAQPTARFRAHRRRLPAGWWSMRRVPLDAIPDLSRHAGDRLLALGPQPRHHRGPGHLSDRHRDARARRKVKAVRGFSDFGYSYVYIIFEDGTDIYWARSRTLEYLAGVLPRLPQGVRTELGPGRHRRRLGLSVRAGGHSRASTAWRDLRSLQDWYLRYHLQVRAGRGRSRAARRLRAAVPGQRGSQPLQAYGIPISKVVEAVRGGNNDVGGAAGRVRRRRVHGARARLCAVRATTSRRSC